MTDSSGVHMIAVIALVTIALRFLPFLIFSGKRETPAYISYLGKVLPFAIMGMLVVYCLRNISFSAFPAVLRSCWDAAQLPACTFGNAIPC